MYGLSPTIWEVANRSERGLALDISPLQSRQYIHLLQHYLQRWDNHSIHACSQAAEAVSLCVKFELFFFHQGFRTAAEQQISELQKQTHDTITTAEPDLEPLRRAAKIIFDQYLSEKVLHHFPVQLMKNLFFKSFQFGVILCNFVVLPLIPFN